MAELTIDLLRKDFGAITVLNEVSLQVESGTFVSLLGPSGCGKSTLLRCVAGLERTTSGRVLIEGKDVTALPPEQRLLGMMFQSYALFPHMTVLENVRFPLRMRKTESRAGQRKRAREALDLVRMADFADRLPRQLSGGQQQRVALARAVVARPRVLLLDEPLSNLDARLREEMQIELIELHRQLKLTTVFVTHDQDEAMSLSDLVVLMSAGNIDQIGTPREIYDQPRSRFAADFLGAANLIPGNYADSTVELADGNRLLVGEALGEGAGFLVLRQEDVRLGARRPKDDSVLPVTVVARVFRGAEVQYVAEYAGTRLRIVAPKDAPVIDPGPAELSWKSSTARFLV